MNLESVGGGKRGSSSVGAESKVSKKTKDEKVDEAELEYKTNVLKIQALLGVPLIANAAAHATAFFEAVNVSPDTVITSAISLPGVSTRQLEKLLSMASNSEETRIRALAKALFEDDIDKLTEVISGMTMIKAVLESAVTFAFYAEFLSENGTFEWKRYEKALTTAIKDKATAKGHAEGRAAERPANAP